MFNKILIANRGEIACRIIRTARRLGIRTVAVYSDADANALHVTMADEARRIGRAPARESYLSIARVLDAARSSGAQAIHPGYGFLSENPDFAQACQDAGVVFIGPSAKSIRAIGDKAAAKAIMQGAGIPIVPGYHGEAQDAARFQEEAQRIGYPILVKAAAGGGGRGMRVVPEASALAAALDSARREAQSAFGNGRLILEKYLAGPRHIEVQVFGDGQGTFVHLFERDCSAQRRHQKVLEEAPASFLDTDLREALGATAVAAARTVDYVGAGTVEFLVQGRGIYFIEMNTRLQVEHPVTEMVTGLDLVERQIRIAAGESWPAQPPASVRGHAIEARLYAEDPARDFAPASGILRQFRMPPAAPDLRIETGMREGDEVPIFYDALLAKLVAWGADRGEARSRLEAALAQVEIAGIATNRDFLLRLVQHPDFAKGAIDTGFIEQHRSALTLPVSAAPLAAFAAASLVWLNESSQHFQTVDQRDVYSPWNTRDGWRLVGETEYEIRWIDAGRERWVSLKLGRDGLVLAADEGKADLKLHRFHGPELEFECGATPVLAKVGRQETNFDTNFAADFEVTIADQSWHLRRLDPFARESDPAIDPARVAAPVHGRVLDVLVLPGENVKRGQALVLLECMKLEYRVTAPADGRIEALHYAAGDVVEEGALLLAFSPAADA
jgi:3-methylcrotonyl-CoA carboxylase alpha subunit